MTVEPTRLIDDAATAGALKGDLQVAAAARVEGLSFSAGLAQLESAIGAETGAIPAVGQATGSLAPKLAVGAVAVAVAAWFGLREPTPPPSPQVPVAVATPEPELPMAAGTAVAPQPEPAPVVDETPAVAPTPDEEPEATAEPEPEPKPAAGRAKAKPHRPKADNAADPDPHLVLQEAKAVQAARRALATTPADALKQAKQIARDFPKGQLVEERRAIEIQALAKLGRDDEARTKAEAFLIKYGRGPHAAAVRRATGL